MVQEICHLKIFLIHSSYGSPFVKSHGTVCVILVEGIMRNIYVKLLFELGPVIQEMSFKVIFPILSFYGTAEPFVQLY